MPYSLQDKLVIGVASSALFDLTESDAIFRDKGENAYREYQEKNLSSTLSPGVAFPFIRRLLALNDLVPEHSPLVEVIILSRNDPDTGLRVMRSIAQHGLPISRAIFRQGRSPYNFMRVLNMSLFLSASAEAVKEAINLGFAAGQVLGTPTEDPAGKDLRIALDFDGVLADDSSEKIMQEKGLAAFHENESRNTDTPIPRGRLFDFLSGINKIQSIEDQKYMDDASYNRRLHVAIVTARNAPSHERVIRTIKSWGLRVNDAFFLGGIEKAPILQELRPHIFFDDQLTHLEGAADAVPSVHIPFGVTNRTRDNDTA